MEKTALKSASLGPGEDARPRARVSTADEAHPLTEVGRQEKGLLAATGAAGEGAAAPVGASRKITLDFLINRLNFINFQEGCIHLHFTDRRYGRSLVVPAAPLPCCGPELECRWAAEIDGARLSETHELKFIRVPRGERFIQSVPEAVEILAGGCRLALPELSRETSHRSVERQRCRGIRVHVIQSSSSFPGTLLDFSASSFRVELRAEPPQSFDWIDAALPVQVIFHSGRQTLYSSECRIRRTAPGVDTRGYVLEPVKCEVQRYRKAEFRSERQVLNPSPNMIFRHPLTQKQVDLKVLDLSGSGFSVEEDETASLLLPGLILPEVELSFGNLFRMKCSVQVVFRKPLNSHDKRLRARCGLALIDITAQDHIKLLGILHQVKDRNSYVCNPIDLEALWDFLFETGFIYPAKYALIEKNKKEIKETYAKLYRSGLDIARHFVYQDNGAILGHMAMIRFWQSTWLIHHHAARRSALTKAGLAVLRQISHFTHDTYRLRSLHMDCLACYYRPQNKFPRRVFGGFAQSMGNPQACSVDRFAYLRLPVLAAAGGALPEGWQVRPATDRDVSDLNGYYQRVSGGLMLRAFDLEPGSWQADALDREYGALGFQRIRRLLALTHRGRLKVLLIACRSDFGLNLSDLTRCVHAIVLDPEGLDPETFTTSVQLASRSVGLEDIVALVYPERYPAEHSIPTEKTYDLWTFHVYAAGQAYLKYLSRLTRHL